MTAVGYVSNYPCGHRAGTKSVCRLQLPRQSVTILVQLNYKKLLFFPKH